MAQILRAFALLAVVGVAISRHVNDDDYHTASMLKRSVVPDIGWLAENKYTPPEEMEPQFWLDVAYDEIEARLQKLNLNKAKNIIMFLGDGMSLSTAAAARILKGQRQQKTGEEEALSFEKFRYSGLSKTYCANAQVADSACTATAYLCGVKTNIVTIGVSAKVNFNNCSASMDPANHVSSIAAWAQAAGKSTGIITTTTLTHASPSGAYAHVANRLWESDANVRAYGADPAECTDIAQQLITEAPGRYFDVMLGGGTGKFVPNNVEDPHGNLGEREDGVNLLTHWKGLHPRGSIVHTRQELLDLNVSKVSNILGLFNTGLMNFHAAGIENEPTLSEMTEVALKLLRKNKRGYFVFIEGGLIDYGNHANKAGISTDETLEFSKAIELAREMTDPADTLIVVTADHAHPLSISGYPGRGTDILNLNQHDVDSNGIKYATLNYAVGPNQYLDENGQREDLTGQIGAEDFTFPSYIKSSMGVHSGDDVGVYASGPYEHIFSGVIQQNSIPHMMAYASCIGDGPKLCDKNSGESDESDSSDSSDSSESNEHDD